MTFSVGVCGEASTFLSGARVLVDGEIGRGLVVVRGTRYELSFLQGLRVLLTFPMLVVHFCARQWIDAMTR